MTTFKDSRKLTEADFMEVGHDQGLSKRFDYFSNAKFDGTPVAQEVFINGVKDNRLVVPEDSMVFGRFVVAAWNETDNSAATAAFATIDFCAMNDSGTVTFTPTNLTGALGNPITLHTAGVGTIALAADGTNDAVALNFTGAANKNYLVRAYAQVIAIGKDSKENPNWYTATT